MSGTGTATLALDDVSMVFRSSGMEVTAVRSVTVQVQPGETLAIVGPSGSGKTTLLSIAGCLLSPTSGRIRIMGEDVTSVGRARQSAIRLRHIGFVFQSFHLLPALPALENVEIAMNLAGVRGRPAFDRARELLELLDLGHRAGVLPSRLSGGERQRLAVARALANRPEIILADEPTASLDSTAGHRVMDLMHAAVQRGEAKSLVVVTHDTRILGMADRVLLMEDGRLRIPEVENQPLGDKTEARRT